VSDINASAITRRRCQEHLDRHLTDGQWHDDCIWCLERRKKGGTGVELVDLRNRVAELESALAAAELRGAQRQREADVKALRDRVQWAKWCADRYIADGGQLIDIRQPTDGADYLSVLPLAASPEETQP